MTNKYISLLVLSTFLTGASIVFADQVSITKFKGLNNQSNSVIIDQSEASDLLNVDVSPTGNSIKKRSGYGTYKALATGKAMHGGYHAYDSTGNDYQLWMSSTSLYAIVADGTPVLLTTATLNSTLDCTDTQGSSYCVDSNRDWLVKTAGATQTTYLTPLGTMIESTPDRVVIAGVSGSPNTLFVSQSNTFTNYTTGVNVTDAFNEVIASPGSKLTHIRWGCGKLLWWKDQSFGYFDFDNQYTATVKAVSDTIGTFDNTSAIDPGGNVWFRGQDGHTWKYDCSALEKESIEITPNVQASGKRTANSWTQTTQADFGAGFVTGNSPSVALSTAITSGDIVVSSFGVTETSSIQWGSPLGTVNGATVGTSSITVTINNSGNITDNGFETNPLTTNWTTSVVGSDSPSSVTSANTLNCTNILPDTGSRFLKFVTGPLAAITVQIVDVSASTVLSSTVIPAANNACGWALRTLSAGPHVGKRFRIKFLTGNGSYIITKDSYILGGDITFRSFTDGDVAVNFVHGFDSILLGSSTITSGSFTSQTFDTGFTSSTIQLQTAYTANSSTPSFAVQHTSSTAAPIQWATLLTSTGTSAIGNRYIRYVSTIGVNSTDTAALTGITNATLVARSSGTFYSAIKNAPNITSWSTFGVNQALGGGTETFYMRASTNSFTILSSTPAWTAQTVGSLVTISTGTFFQVRDDFGITAATNTPTLNDFTINWFEGSATDQAYMIYFDNAIWESVAFGAGQPVNNYIFKKDLINDAWTLYNFGAGGMCVQANTLYFGDTSLGSVYNFGSATSDNGSAINAYWKTKDFTGSDPFLQNQLTNIDTFAKKNQGSTLTTTYTTDTSTATAYSISLSTPNAIVQSRKLLPGGKLGYTFNVQYGDTSASSAWEILGFRIGYIQLPYRSTP